jgi:hypothetical protein
LLGLINIETPALDYVPFCIPTNKFSGMSKQTRLSIVLTSSKTYFSASSAPISVKSSFLQALILY